MIIYISLYWTYCNGDTHTKVHTKGYDSLDEAIAQLNLARRQCEGNAAKWCGGYVVDYEYGLSERIWYEITEDGTVEKRGLFGIMRKIKEASNVATD